MKGQIEEGQGNIDGAREAYKAGVCLNDRVKFPNYPHWGATYTI